MGTSGFNLQYVSLILIMLTIFVGFKIDNRSNNIKSSYVEEIPLKTINLKSLFIKDSAEVESSIAESIVYLLSNHDLQLTINLYDDSKKSGLALARAVSLSRFMQNSSVISSSYKIWAFPSINSEQIVGLWKMEVASRYEQ